MKPGRHQVRRYEIDVLARHFPPGARILEIGAGTGEQARALCRRGFVVTAVDVPTSEYGRARVFEVLDYDGKRLPFPGASFDVVFSSNVLEHLEDLPAMLAEMRRVLRPGGELRAVWNSHLDYRPALQRLVGSTRQVARTPKFTVTASRAAARGDDGPSPSPSVSPHRQGPAQ